MRTAKTLIEELRLSPHPEGGWDREAWRAPAEHGERERASAIYFLLEAHQHSHWHKVDAAEIWLWHAGDPLLLSLAVSPKGPVHEARLGPDVIAGDRPQVVVGAHEWQSAVPLPGNEGYSLVSCIVTPGFKFSGFTLAPPNWRPGE
jgi:predicted cupin superfamily sugar epimerase